MVNCFFTIVCNPFRNKSLCKILCLCWPLVKDFRLHIVCKCLNSFHRSWSYQFHRSKFCWGRQAILNLINSSDQLFKGAKRVSTTISIASAGNSEKSSTKIYKFLTPHLFKISFSEFIIFFDIEMFN